MTSTTAPTRRERQRQATYDEIVEVARRLLRSSPDDLSLRAVAGEMGMTPPALYRYVDSYAGLLGLVARSIFADVVAALMAARDAFPDDDPAAQIVAAATAFRRWALENPAEFRMAFATHVPDPDLRDGTGDEVPTQGQPLATTTCAYADDVGSDQFTAVFQGIFERLWLTYRFPVPSDDELDPDVLRVLRSLPGQSPIDQSFGQVTPGMVWTFERAWARLYGTVTLEVFGHIHPEYIRTGVLFAATLLDIGRDVGIADEWDRLRPITRATPST